MHENEQGFLDAIIANPEDISLRLIYADWLIERGDERGELILSQYKGEQRKISTKQFRTMFEIWSIPFKLSFNKHGILARNRHHLFDERFIIRHGFIEECQMSTYWWFNALGCEIAKKHPVRFVYLTNLVPRYAGKWMLYRGNNTKYPRNSADNRLFFDTSARHIAMDTREQIFNWVSVQCIKWARAQNV